MIKVDNLTIRYPKVLAVDNLTLELKPGIVYGLIGPNGAGKSSLLKSLVGLISEYEGEIYYDDLILRKNRQQIKSLIGYAPEDPDLFPYLTGREYLKMISEIRNSDNIQLINEIANELSLEFTINELINRYSHGMRQKISFAAALIAKPQNIILDEALNGFDPVSLYNAKSILQHLSREGKTILLSSHVLELMEKWCEEIIIMNKGKIIDIYTIEKIAEIKKQTGKGFNEHFISLIQDDS